MALDSTVGGDSAESYISVAEADTYFSEHGSPSQWVDLTVDAKESALRYATVYLENHWRFKSRPLTNTQALWFPSYEFLDSRTGRVLGGEGVIPEPIKDMTAELALRHSIKDLFLDSTTGQNSSNRIVREKVGIHEVEFADPSDNSSYLRNYFPLISLRLKPYVLSAAHTVPVWRGY